MRHEARAPLRERSDSIDQFRGLLIVCVVLGHFFEITGSHPFVTWLGFGIRMPLFIGLTGYLFNLDRARAAPLHRLLRRYNARLVVPWVAACAVYILIADPIDWFAPLHAIVRPPYHLWFVPVVLAFIVIAWSSNARPRTMLAVALPVSIAAMCIFGVGHGITQYSEWVPDRRYFIFPGYFFFGLCVARRRPRIGMRVVAVALASLGLAWWAYLYFHPSVMAEVAAELLLCLPLIYLLSWIRDVDFRVPGLRMIGRDSLFFYLWHPLALGLWTALAVSELSLLALAVASLGVAWAIVARMPMLGPILGISRATLTARPVPDAAPGEEALVPVPAPVR